MRFKAFYDAFGPDFSPFWSQFFAIVCRARNIVLVKTTFSCCHDFHTFSLFYF